MMQQVWVAFTALLGTTSILQSPIVQRTSEAWCCVMGHAIDEESIDVSAKHQDVYITGRADMTVK